MKSKAFIIAAISSLVIIAIMFVINFITSFGHPWFIYPSFVVLWWPLSVYFAANKNFRLYSVAASVLSSVFFLLFNLITSPGYMWFIFPVFAIWWWPLSQILCGEKKYKLYAVVSSIYIVAFLALVNILTSLGHPWFIYPSFGIAWWPLAMFFAKKNPKLFSAIMSFVTIAFLALVNVLTSWGHPWVLYAAFGIVWWPLTMFLAKKNPKTYSVVMSLVTLGFLAIINLITTPGYIWFHQTIFFILWWPVITLLGKKAKTLTFAIISAAVIIGYSLLVYYLQTPGAHPWYLYVIFPAVWWPVSLGFKKYITKVWFLIASLVLMLAYYCSLNLILLPSYFWTIYLIYPALWAFMGVFFGSRKWHFGLSICAAIMTIVFFAVVNLITSPGVVWYVFPAFAILWWPLSIYFFIYRKKKASKT